jgi:Ser/Thr protein kinase RdoA (MazF antagonist)
MIGPDAEEPLTGGATRAGVVRIGDTVRRPRTDRSAFVERVLSRLESASVDGMPRWLGSDAQGRDVLSYQQGDTGHDRDTWTDEQLTALARLVRSMHDALAGSPEADGAETVCHNDIAPWNAIFADGQPVGLIDFDDAAPGQRIEDVAYLAWMFCPVGPDGQTVTEQSRRIRHVCAAYNGGIPLRAPIGPGFVDALLAQHNRIAAMRRARAEQSADPQARAFNLGRAGEIDASRDWVRTHRDVLQRPPG